MRDPKRLIASVSVVVLASLIAVGVVAFHTDRGKHAEKIANSNLLTTEAAEGRFIESDGYYSLKVPPRWIADTFVVKGSSSTIALVPTETTEVRLGPNAKEVDLGNAVVVEVFKANPDLTAWEKDQQSQAPVNGTVITNLAIGGQPAFLENTNSDGNRSLAYYIGHGAYIVEVSMPVTISSTKINNSQYVNQFNDVAKSLIILK
jgi:hypothetical protein